MRINHIALYCMDLEGMKEFFIRYFNGAPNQLYHNPKTGLKTYILSFPGSDARLDPDCVYDVPLDGPQDSGSPARIHSLFLQRTRSYAVMVGMQILL